MNICVFCSAGEVEEKYKRAATELATLIGKSGHTLVWGGSDRGLMSVVARGAQTSGGKIVGITFELLRDRAHDSADEMIVEADLASRKSTMLARSDAFAVLVGGLGTLDELTEVIELRKHNLHQKPVVVLNTDGFFDGFKMQLERMEKEGFLRGSVSDVMHFASTPDEAMRYIEAHGK